MSTSPHPQANAKVAVMGAAGRMGRMITQVVLDDENLTLVGATTIAGCEFHGTDVGLLIAESPHAVGVALTSDTKSAIENADVIIDFTATGATLNHLSLCAELGVNAVVGTTGFTPEQEQQIADYAQKTGIVFAPNYSIGVNILLSLCEQVASMLPAEDFDIEVLEMHHKHKVDAPSGTALGLGRATAQGRGVDHEDVKQTVRSGITGARPQGEIGYATLRGGSVIGDHTVMFVSDEERIEIGHKAVNRALFAKGAVRAAKWVVTQPTKLYSMKDVIGL